MKIDIKSIRERAERAGDALSDIVKAHWEKRPIPLKMSIPVKADLSNNPDTDVLLFACIDTDIPALCDRVEELEAERPLWSTAHLVLSLIAEGYHVGGKNDRYVIVENPNYRPDNGSDKFIVYDCGKPG